MSQNTFPAFTNMIPTVEDMQLVVDSLREETRSRLTKDSIFFPGIVNEQGTYLQAGTLENSLRINPFVAYTANGNRIEVSSTWDNLYAQGNVINITRSNLVQEDIPVWRTYYKTISDLRQDQDLNIETIKLTSLGRGSILHGIKVHTAALFEAIGSSTRQNVWISIGTEAEPNKFLPETLVSDNNASTNISVMNLMYSLDDANPTELVITFTSDGYLNQLTSGSVVVNLCIADLSIFDNGDLDPNSAGYELNSITVVPWMPSTTYHIVARYKEDPSNYRQLNYKDSNNVNITTVSEPTRFTTSYGFYALRKSGAIIDYTTPDDVKLGEIVTNEQRDIIEININGQNSIGDYFTEYLRLPIFRISEALNVDLSTKVSKSGDTMTGPLTMDYGNRLTFLGGKTYNLRSASGSSQFNLYSSNGKGLLIQGENDNLYYYDGTNSYRLYDTSYPVANPSLSNLDASGQSKFDSKVNKSGDTMTGNLILSKSAEHFVAKDTDLDINITPTGSNVDGGFFSIKDKNDQLFSRIFASSTTNGYNATSMQVTASNLAASAKLTVEIKKDGTGAFGTAPTPPADSSGTQIVTAAWGNGKYVKKAGDTMSGTLNNISTTTSLSVTKASDHIELYDTQLDRTTTPTQSQVNGNFITSRDKNGKIMARFYTASTTDGTNATAIQAWNGNEQSQASLGIKIEKSGTYATGFAPTPLTASAGPEIVTAAWVRNLLGNDTGVTYLNDKILYHFVATKPADTTSTTITLPIVMADNNYAVMMNPMQQPYTSLFLADSWGAGDLTTTSFTLWSNNTGLLAYKVLIFGKVASPR